MIHDSRETVDVVDSTTKAHQTVQEFRKKKVYYEKKAMKHCAANVLHCNKCTMALQYECIYFMDFAHKVVVNIASTIFSS